MVVVYPHHIPWNKEQTKRWIQKAWWTTWKPLIEQNIKNMKTDHLNIFKNWKPIIRNNLINVLLLHVWYPQYPDDWDPALGPQLRREMNCTASVPFAWILPRRCSKDVGMGHCKKNMESPWFSHPNSWDSQNGQPSGQVGLRFLRPLFHWDVTFPSFSGKVCYMRNPKLCQNHCINDTHQSSPVACCFMYCLLDSLELPNFHIKGSCQTTSTTSAFQWLNRPLCMVKASLWMLKSPFFNPDIHDSAQRLGLPTIHSSQSHGRSSACIGVWICLESLPDLLQDGMLLVMPCYFPTTDLSV